MLHNKIWAEGVLKPAADRRSRSCWKLGLGLAMVVLLCLKTALAQTTYTVTDLGTLNDEVFSCAMGLNNHGWTEIMDVLNEGGNFSLHASVNVNGLPIDLGTLGGPNSWINWGGINERGQAVGLSETDVPDPNGEDFCGFGDGLTCRPFLWRAGHMTALPALGGNNGQASAINSGGQIVGTAETTTAESGCPFHTSPPSLWEKGTARPLPGVDGDTDGFAFDINDLGRRSAAPELAPPSFTRCHGKTA
jgi:uncharacterized membrane protein